MKTRNRSILLALALALPALALVACGDGGGGDPGERPAAAAAGGEGAGPAGGGAPAASADGLPEPCLPAAEVGETVGIPVRVLREGTLVSGENVVCAYQATDAGSGTFVSITVGPASGSGEAMEEVRSAAKTFLGTQAEAERIDVGEGGYAYGAASKSEAAAVAGGRLYRVDVGSTGSANIGDKKAAMVELLRRVID